MSTGKVKKDGLSQTEKYSMPLRAERDHSKALKWDETANCKALKYFH